MVGRYDISLVADGLDWSCVLLVTMEKRLACPCQYEEVEPCKPHCTCRSSVMSGGCDRCATYGSLEQRIRKAKKLAEILDSNRK